MTSKASQKRQLTSGTMPASKKQATGKTKTQKTGCVTEAATKKDEGHYVYVVTFESTNEDDGSEFDVVGIYRALKDANNAARKKANAEDPRPQYAEEYLDKDGCVQIQNQEGAHDVQRIDVNVERRLIKSEGSEPETKLGVTEWDGKVWHQDDEDDEEDEDEEEEDQDGDDDDDDDDDDEDSEE